MLQTIGDWSYFPNIPPNTKSHSNLGIEIIIVLVLVVLLLAATFATYKFNKSKQKNADNYETDLPKLQDYGAFVLEKHASLIHTGSYQEPSHEIQFTVDFALENGEIKSLLVPEEAFERIHKGQSGTLVMQEEEFFDFQ